MPQHQKNNEKGSFAEGRRFLFSYGIPTPPEKESPN
jgi:hypothetical protein